MRKFQDGDSIVIEPFRASSFPVIKDLVVDRKSFDRIQHAGGYISINTSGNTQDANTIPIRRIATPQEQADVILFLVSEMSNYIAGAAIDSNGGQF